MFKIHLICHEKKNKILNVSEETKIETIKKQYGNEDIELIYNGTILEDNCKLIDFSIKNETNIYVIKLNTRTLLEKRRDDQAYLIENFMSILNQFNQVSQGIQNNSSVSDGMTNSYENENDTLVSMGFTDRSENHSLLVEQNGNVETVVTILLGLM
jgi:hypothetical protein